MDLCAGTGSATKAFQQRNHEMTYLDIDSRLLDEESRTENSYILEMDIRDFARNPRLHLQSSFNNVDFIWFSPPCRAFSLGASGSGKKRWRNVAKGWYPVYGPRRPVHKVSRNGCAFVLAGKEAIRKIKPKYYLIENPRAGLRTMDFMQDMTRWTITYCQYGDQRMKPTDLWGVMPESFNPKEPCTNNSDCHVAAPRGSKTGTQGINGAKDRGRIPFRFSDYVRTVIEGAV